jgi:RNA polymerase sigma-70 factor (ECF subfamily)
LARLYDASSPAVYALVFRVLRNKADAEEVTIDVYTQVWRTAASFDESRGSVNAWLMMLARSRAIDRLRSRMKDEKQDPLEAAGRIAQSGEASPESVSLNNERCNRIQAALLTLSPEQRTAIELAFYSGLTQSEMAVQLQQPLGTVKTRVRLGMQKLRECLGQHAAGGVA